MFKAHLECTCYTYRILHKLFLQQPLPPRPDAIHKLWVATCSGNIDQPNCLQASPSQKSHVHLIMSDPSPHDQADHVPWDVLLFVVP